MQLHCELRHIELDLVTILEDAEQRLWLQPLARLTAYSSSR